MDAPPGTERQYYAGMKRKHQRTLELIFSRPVNGSLPWRDIEALFQGLGGEVSERAGSRVAVVLFGEVRVFHRPHPIAQYRQGCCCFNPQLV
jgi:hypothetical protein